MTEATPSLENTTFSDFSKNTVLRPPAILPGPLFLHQRYLQHLRLRIREVRTGPAVLPEVPSHLASRVPVLSGYPVPVCRALPVPPPAGRGPLPLCREV